ncbi:MAG: hypothetical protein AB7S72_14900 [Draconibacterium sp.]
MEKLKDLKWIILIVLVIAVFVIVRMTNSGGFKGDARETVATIAAGDFLISVNEYNQNKEAFQVVTFEQPENPDTVQFENSINIQFEKLLEEPAIQKLKETQIKILLVSKYNSQSSKAFVILNQMGFKNVFVLSTRENPEVLKYQFQPGLVSNQKSLSE